MEAGANDCMIGEERNGAVKLVIFGLAIMPLLQYQV